MKKNILIIFGIVLVILIIVVFLAYNKNTQDISKISDNQIISILEKNPDAKDYMQNHNDFKIDKKEILTEEIIRLRQSGVNFKEVYEGLEFEDNRYIKVDLINQAGDRGMVVVVDFKEKTVPHAYGIILLKATQAQVQNGQIPIPAENK